MGSTNFTATDGINKLIKNQPLIIKYLNQSVLSKNYMNIRCTNVKIPGEEIGQNSSFYIYNIEGFFDIEKGIYCPLIQLLQAMKFLNEKNISITSYGDLEEKVNLLLAVIRAVDCINYNFTSKNDKNVEQEQKCQCRENTEKIEEKKNEMYSFILKIKDLLYLSFSWTKTEEKSIEPINEVKEKEEQNTILEKIKNIDLNRISNYESFILFIMELLKQFNIHKYPGIRNAIDWLRNIISFNELNELVKCGIRVVSGTISGITHILHGINNLPNNKIASTINIATGVLEIAKAGLDVYNTNQKFEIKKKEANLSKAQNNFRQLVNKMDELFIKLINSNLEEFKKNNIIILGIDQSDNVYNEGTDLQLFYIKNIDNYAKCISENEKDRVKYIENMIYFYQKILPKLSELTIERGKEINIKLDFFLSLQTLIIKNFNNKNFWIELDEDKIEKFIAFMEKEHEKRKECFKNNGEEIKKRFIQMLEETTNVQNKDCEPPAPTID